VAGSDVVLAHHADVFDVNPCFNLGSTDSHVGANVAEDIVRVSLLAQ
jgi:hypothetical protein